MPGTLPSGESLLFQSLFGLLRLDRRGDLLARSDSLRICAHMKTLQQLAFYFFLVVKIRESYLITEKKRGKKIMFFTFSFFELFTIDFQWSVRQQELEKCDHNR